MIVVRSRKPEQIFFELVFVNFGQRNVVVSRWGNYQWIFLKIKRLVPTYEFKLRDYV